MIMIICLKENILLLLNLNKKISVLYNLQLYKNFNFNFYSSNNNTNPSQKINDLLINDPILLNKIETIIKEHLDEKNKII